MAAEVTTIQLEDGSIVGLDNPMPMAGVNVFSTDVAIHDSDTPANHLDIDSNGRVTTVEAHGLSSTSQQGTGLGGIAVKICDPDASRAFVRVTNISIHVVFIGTTGAVTHSTGTAIPPNQYQDFPHEGELYVCSANTGDTVTVASFGA